MHMRRMRSESKQWLILLLWVGCLFFFPARLLSAQSGGAVILTEAQDEYPLGPHLEFLEDAAGVWTIEEVASEEFNGRFRPSHQEVPNFGFTPSVYWFRVRLRDETKRPMPWRLEIKNALLNTIDFYVPTPEGDFIHQQAGSFVPLTGQEIIHHHPTFTFDLPPQTEQPIYWRVEENAALIVPTTLWSPDAFIAEAQSEQLILGLSYGILLIMIGYNLFLYFFLHDRSYLYYVSFIASYALGQATIDGLTRQYLWPGWGRWNDMAGVFFAPLAAISLLYFTDHFLQVQTYVPRYHRLIKILGGLWLLLLLLVPIVPFIVLIPALLLLLLVSLFTALMVGVLVQRAGFRPARYFLLAWVTPLVGGVIFVLARMGSLPYNVLTQQSPRLGVILLVLLLSVALADQIDAIRRERGKALAQTKGVNEELEERVVARTAELAATNQQLTQLLTKQEQIQASLQQQASQLHALREIALEITGELELTVLLQSIITRAAELVQTNRGGLFLWQPEREVLELVATTTKSALPVGLTMRAGEGLAGRVWASDQPMMVNDYQQWDGQVSSIAAKIQQTAILCVPIRWREEKMGVLAITDRSGRTFLPEDVELLNLFALQAAVAIQNARLLTQLQRKTESLESEIFERRQMEDVLQHYRGHLEDLVAARTAELEAKNAELERFTYTVSHDLRSPLVTVKGFLGFLERDAAQGDMTRLGQDVQRIREATVKMEQLLNDLLELSRIGRLVNQLQTIPFNELVEEAVSLVAGRIAERQVQVDIAPDMPSVTVDRSRLVEVLQNLIDNGVKFMGNQAEPQIEIGVKEVARETVFFVKDNGVGIEPKYHDKVFGLFDRLDPTIEGTGIGLALVKRIIEVHNGRVWIESNGEGQGATFCFTLP